MQTAPDNQQVKLPKKIPVYIVYFTTYVHDGQLYFGNDLYDRDSKLVQQVQDVAGGCPDAEGALESLRQMAKS